MKRSYAWLLLAFLLGAAPTTRAPAEEPFVKRDKIANAALQYWQAFAMLPELSEQDQKLLAPADGEQPERAAVRELLDRSQSAMELAAQVGPATPCRWEIVENGPATLIPHLGKARRLVQLLVMQAEADMAAGQQAAAVDHLASALLLARNVDEGTLVQMLTGIALEAKVFDAAERMLPDLDAASAERLSAAFAKLPPQATMAQSIHYERRVFAEWLRPMMTGDIQQATAQLKELGAGDIGDMAALFAGSKEQRTERFEEFLKGYDQLAAAAQLPADQAKARFVEIDKRYDKSTNPLTRLLMPAIGRAHEYSLKGTERAKNFTAALQQRVKQSPQPK